MTSILRTLARPFRTEQRALDFQTIFGHDITQPETSRLTTEQARKNPFVWACQSIISGTIANLPMDVLEKQGPVRLPVADPPSWVDVPNPLNPNYTAISYKRQVSLSLVQDGNAFIAAYPSVFDPQQLLVLNPAQVEIKDGDGMPEYVVTGGGREMARLTPLDCIHIPFILPPGYTRGLNPVEAAALSIGIDLASQKQNAKFLNGGGLVTGVIEVPAEAGVLTKTQQDDLRDSFKRRREGPAGYSIGVLTGGATFKPVSQSQAESEYIAGRKMSREEIAGMYLVPAFMIGSQEPGGVAYASAVERAQHFIDYCLIHYTGPMELGHRRLVDGADTYVKFNYGALLRGDFKTRTDIYHSLLGDKVITRNEVREKEDWAPLDDGGFLETPNNNGIPSVETSQPRSEPMSVNVTTPPVTMTISDGAIRNTVEGSTHFLEPVTVEQTPHVEVMPPAVNVEMDPVIEAVRALADTILNQPKPPTVIATEFIRDDEGHTQFIERHFSDGTLDRQAVKRDGGRLALVKSA